MTTHHKTLARAEAESIVRKFTAAAVATGAVPFPATSLAIIAENAAMVAAVANALGAPVSLKTVVRSMSAFTAVNLIGRGVFVEAARSMGWFGGPLGIGGIVALGAVTAGVQTWTLGTLAIALCESANGLLPAGGEREVLGAGDEAYASALAAAELITLAR